MEAVGEKFSTAQAHRSYGVFGWGGIDIAEPICMRYVSMTIGTMIVEGDMVRRYPARRTPPGLREGQRERLNFSSGILKSGTKIWNWKWFRSI